jgi:acyl CoA:acetate/3-ketoacid CoA transferase beta subunit
LPNGKGLELIEKANDYSVDDIKTATGCDFIVSDHLKSMEE